jgi:3-oxoacyl-[acyl-carrier-protein] synthase II
MMADRKRVVVTGMGLITALGLDPAATWAGMLAGKTGIRRIASLDLTDLKATNGAEVNTSALAEAMKARKIAPADRAVDMAILAASQALENAAVISGPPPYSPQEMPVILGTGCGSTESYYATMKALFEKGVKAMRPTSVPRCMANASSAQVRTT